MTTGGNTPPAPKRRSVALPFNLLIDDPSILALLNDDDRIWFGLIDTDFAFNDGDRRHIRQHPRLLPARLLMTPPDYPSVFSPPSWTGFLNIRYGEVTSTEALGMIAGLLKLRRRARRLVSKMFLSIRRCAGSIFQNA